MESIDLTSYRGTRDFLPEDYFVQSYIYDSWRKVCQRFGYEEYQGPTVEPLSLYASKTSREIVEKQTFSFTDRGGRELTIRPEMTPTVARMVTAKQQELGYPLRLFSIPNCMRYERPQKGRLREFWQLNVDIFGVESLAAERETIELVVALMTEFGAMAEDYTVRVNSRQLLVTLAKHLGISTDQLNNFTNLLDRRDKLPSEDFNAQLSELTDKIELSESYLAATSLSDITSDMADSDGFRELEQLLSEIKHPNVVFDPTITRGFDYYTGIVFEVMDENPDNNRSMFGGGRYDKLIEQFGGQPLPTVGFGMGDAVLEEFLRSRELLPAYQPKTSVYLIPIQDSNIADADQVARVLRDGEINTAVDYSGRKTDKQLKTALKHGIPYAIFIGDEEVKTKQYSLRHLSENTEKTVPLEEIIAVLK